MILIIIAAPAGRVYNPSDAIYQKDEISNSWEKEQQKPKGRNWVSKKHEIFW